MRFAILMGFIIIAFAVASGCAPEKVVGPKGERGERGPSGPEGEDGANAVIDVIDPCGQETEFDEVILRLRDGRLYAYFIHNRHGRMVLLDAGDFITTDGTNCHFTVTEEGDVTWN